MRETSDNAFGICPRLPSEVRDIFFELFQDAIPLLNINKSTLDSILKAASQLMNCVHREFEGGDLYFVPHVLGGGDSLIYWLKEAIKHNEEPNCSYA